MKTNNVMYTINTRATRSVDATITWGVVKVTFARGTISLNVDNYIRDLGDNRQKMAQIERIIHNYIDELITTETMARLAEEVQPISQELLVI